MLHSHSILQGTKNIPTAANMTHRKERISGNTKNADISLQQDETPEGLVHLLWLFVKRIVSTLSSLGKSLHPGACLVALLLRIHSALVALTSVLYPKRRRLLAWVRSQVPFREIPDLVAIWRDGGLLCAIVEAAVAPQPDLCCRFDKYRVTAMPSLRLGQRLAAEYLHVPPAFSEPELTQEPTSTIIARLADYLLALKSASKQLRDRIEIEELPMPPQFLARGMGLFMALQGRRATFCVLPGGRRTLFPRGSPEQQDALLVEIKGPNGDHGCLAVTARGALANHNSTGNIITITVVISLESCRVTYKPRSSGHHEVTLLHRNLHIAGSPYRVKVETVKDDLLPETTDNMEILPLGQVTRIVDFVTEKNLIMDTGELIPLPNLNKITLTSRELSKELPVLPIFKRRAKHVLVHRKLIGHKKLINVKKLINEEKINNNLKNYDKIIHHSTENKSDFKDVCKRILWACDLLLKKTDKNKCLKMLNTAEQIISTEESYIQEDKLNLNSQSKQAKNKHLHANHNISDNDGLLQQGDSEKQIDQYLTNESDSVSTIPDLSHRDSEPIELLRKQCGLSELDDFESNSYKLKNSSRNEYVPSILLQNAYVKNEYVSKEINCNEDNTIQLRDEDFCESTHNRVVLRGSPTCCSMKQYNEDELNVEWSSITDVTPFSENNHLSSLDEINNCTLTNYDSQLPTKSLHETLKHIESIESVEDKVNEWMGPIEKEIWEHELQWYNGEYEKEENNSGDMKLTEEENDWLFNQISMDAGNEQQQQVRLVEEHEETTISQVDENTTTTKNENLLDIDFSGELIREVQDHLVECSKETDQVKKESIVTTQDKNIEDVYLKSSFKEKAEPISSSQEIQSKVEECTSSLCIVSIRNEDVVLQEKLESEQGNKIIFSVNMDIEENLHEEAYSIIQDIIEDVTLEQVTKLIANITCDTEIHDAILEQTSLAGNDNKELSLINVDNKELSLIDVDKNIPMEMISKTFLNPSHDSMETEEVHQTLINTQTEVKTEVITEPLREELLLQQEPSDIFVNNKDICEEQKTNEDNNSFVNINEKDNNEIILSKENYKIIRHFSLDNTDISNNKRDLKNKLNSYDSKNSSNNTEETENSSKLIEENELEMTYKEDEKILMFNNDTHEDTIHSDAGTVFDNKSIQLEIQFDPDNGTLDTETIERVQTTIDEQQYVKNNEDLKLHITDKPVETTEQQNEKENIQYITSDRVELYEDIPVSNMEEILSNTKIEIQTEEEKDVSTNTIMIFPDMPKDKINTFICVANATKEKNDIGEMSIDKTDEHHEETTTNDNDVVEATKLLSMSLRRLSVTQEEKHCVPEYLQLLAHSPDIASLLSTPSRTLVADSDIKVITANEASSMLNTVAIKDKSNLSELQLVNNITSTDSNKENLIDSTKELKSNTKEPSKEINDAELGNKQEINTIPDHLETPTETQERENDVYHTPIKPQIETNKKEEKLIISKQNSFVLKRKQFWDSKVSSSLEDSINSSPSSPKLETVTPETIYHAKRVLTTPSIDDTPPNTPDLIATQRNVKPSKVKKIFPSKLSTTERSKSKSLDFNFSSIDIRQRLSIFESNTTPISSESSSQVQCFNYNQPDIISLKFHSEKKKDEVVTPTDIIIKAKPLSIRSTRESQNIESVQAVHRTLSSVRIAKQDSDVIPQQSQSNDQMLYKGGFLAMKREIFTSKSDLNLYEETNSKSTSSSAITSSFDTKRDLVSDKIDLICSKVNTSKLNQIESAEAILDNKISNDNSTHKIKNIPFHKSVQSLQYDTNKNIRKEINLNLISFYDDISNNTKLVTKNDDNKQISLLENIDSSLEKSQTKKSIDKCLVKQKKCNSEGKCKGEIEMKVKALGNRFFSSGMKIINSSSTEKASMKNLYRKRSQSSEDSQEQIYNESCTSRRDEQRTAKDQQEYHIVKYTTMPAKVAIVPSRHETREETGLSLYNQFSVDITPTLAIETEFVNPLCTIDGLQETKVENHELPKQSTPIADCDTRDRFERAKNFFKNLESGVPVKAIPKKHMQRKQSFASLSSLPNTTHTANLRFASERQIRLTERFHVKDLFRDIEDKVLFRDIEDKTVGARGIPNREAAVASLYSMAGHTLSPTTVITPEHEHFSQLIEHSSAEIF